MKRKAAGLAAPAKAKKAKEPEQDYCDIEPRHADDGSILWPATPTSMNLARDFLREW